MKKFILVLASLMALNAHATKARLAALNQDTNGSYFIADTRNIFLNPAQLASMKDHLNFEWGKQERSGISTAVPENEGGFVMSLGAGKLAAQLGRVTDFDNLVREVNGGLTDVGTNVVGGNFGEGQNNVDVIYSGGGADMHWGGGVAITRSKTATNAPDKQQSVQAFDFRGGVANDRFDAFGSILLGASSATDVGTTDGKLSESFGLRGGGSFQVKPDFKAYGHLSYDKYTANQGNGGPEYDGKRLSLTGGAVYLRNLEENARMFASAELLYLDHVASGNKGIPDEKYQYIGVPVNIGIEADANTWARVRASVRQNILIGSTKTTTGNTASDNNKWENAPNSTAVAFGVGASANKFNFDLALAQALATNDNAHVEAAMTFIF